MRLLFIHEVNWWTKVVYEIHELPELLSQRGHVVTLIDFPEGVKRSGFRRFLDLKTTIRTKAHRAYAGSLIEVRTPGRVCFPPIDRLVASITFVPLLKKTLKEKRPEVIVLYGVPTNGWQTIRVARKFGIPVVFRALDVSHALRKSVFTPLIKCAERFIYKNADLVSANNEALARYCISEGANPELTLVHYPGMDLAALAPRERDEELAVSLGIQTSDRVVMFMGTLYRFAGLDTFLKLMAPTLKQSPNMKVLFIGGGEHHDVLVDLAAALGIGDQVIFTGFVDYRELGRFMTLGNVAINTFPRSLVTDCALPSKVLQYLCCGLPTVATPVDGLTGLLDEGQGVHFRMLDEGFVRVVVELLHDEVERIKLSAIARSTAEQLLNWNNRLTIFEKELLTLAAPSE